MADHTQTDRVVRIGGASGFWGDSSVGAQEDAFDAAATSTGSRAPAHAGSRPLPQPARVRSAGNARAEARDVQGVEVAVPLPRGKARPASAAFVSHSRRSGGGGSSGGGGGLE